MSNTFSDKYPEYLQKTTLDRATVGKRYAIVECTSASDVSARLAEMGLVPKTAVTVMKVAPLGDPMEISVRGYSLCIRASEAKTFTVREIPQ